MDIAFNTITERLVASEELWELTVIDRNIFCCPDCMIRLKPASHKKTNKKRPYFFHLTSNPHSVGCVYNENSRLIKTAQTQSISNEDGFPFPYPSKLIIEDENTKEANENDSGMPSASTKRNNSKGYGSGEVKLNHHRTVSTIKNIVRHYVCFPNDWHVRLNVPYVGSEQISYETIFKSIWGGNRYLNYQIFYSKIFWNKALEHDDYIEVKLVAGQWDKKVQKKACRLRINVESSQKRQRALVLREINTTINETIENKDAVNGFIFFLGKQDENDSFLFHTDSHKLISCLTVLKTAKL